MNADLHHLVEASLRGDTRAFGEIVERHQGAVCAMAYSVTGNLVQSEDLAQEAFIVAWRKLAGLKKRESLGAWLCGIARNLARDWMRKQSKRPTVALDSVAEPAHPAVESGEEARLRQERSETVWTALSDIPEAYREPLVLFYRQDRSIRAIAETLALSEDCVKQRLSRGRKMLKAEVERMVEDTLEDSRPGRAFTAGVVAALPPLGTLGPNGSSVKDAGSAHTSGFLGGAVTGKVVAVTALALVVLGGLWGTREFLDRKGATDFEADAGLGNPRTDERGASESAGLAPYVSEPEKNAEAPVEGETLSQAAASVSGVVVFRDSGEPADGMKVLFGTNAKLKGTVVTGEDGRFRFGAVSAGQFMLMAYDAHYEETPEDWLRSEPVMVELAEGEAREDIRIEVPSRGAQITGRVYDKNTGAPLAGVKVAAVGTHKHLGTSDGDGRYTIIGLEEGEWRVNLNWNNNIFTSDTVDKMQTTFVRIGTTTPLDLAVDMGTPIRGRVVNAAGESVAAAIDAGLFIAGEGSRPRCSFHTDQDGGFTIWGAAPGDRVVLSARKDEMGSHIGVVNLAKGQAVDEVVLTLKPWVPVTGRFVDARGRAVKAVIWCRAMHPDGNGTWRSASRKPSENFTIKLAQGPYEIKAQMSNLGRSPGQPVQPLLVGTTPLSNVTIRVKSPPALGEGYTLSGIVVDEEDKPLSGMRLNIHISRIQEINLAGRVLDDGTGEAITKFGVHWGKLTETGLESSEHRKTLTSVTGAFEVSTPDENWYLRVTAHGYGPVRETGTGLLPGKKAESLEFRLTPSPIVHGTVKDESGIPVEGVQIYFINPVAASHGHDPSSFLAQMFTEGRTDSEGCYEVTPGDAQFVYAWKTAYAIAQQTIPNEMDIVLTRGGVFEGRVLVNGGVPQERVSVSVGNSDSRYPRWVETDGDGYYRLTELMDAAYSLTVRMDNGTSYSLTDEVAAADGVTVTQDIEIALGSGVVEGVVTRDGMPVEGVSLWCYRAGYKTYCQTDGAGHYSFHDLPAGAVELKIFVPGPATPGRSRTHELAAIEIQDGEVVVQDCDLAGFEEALLLWPYSGVRTQPLGSAGSVGSDRSFGLLHL